MIAKKLGRGFKAVSTAILFVVFAGTVVSGNEKKEEQAVLVHFDYGNKDWKPFFTFESNLEEAIKAAAVGEYDGNELAADGSGGYMYMYGPDADALFAVVKPRLQAATFLKMLVLRCAIEMFSTAPPASPNLS